MNDDVVRSNYQIIDHHSSFIDESDGSSARDRRQPTGRRLGRLRLAVDEILQLLARLEVRHLLRRHIDLVAGLRVAALPRLALPQAETAEPSQLDLLAAVQRVDDALEDGIDDDLGVLLREVRDARDLLDELRLGHAAGAVPVAAANRHCLLLRTPGVSGPGLRPVTDSGSGPLTSPCRYLRSPGTSPSRCGTGRPSWRGCSGRSSAPGDSA